MTPVLRDQLQQLLGSTYTIERELGGGGMSRVFIATETALGRKVVVKVLPPEVAAGVKVERFKREIQFLARLHHPHIVPLLAAGGDGLLSYYVMPFMEGESLRARLLRRGILPTGEAVRTLREVASALSFAHQNAIVHRDIKPDNVLLVSGSALVSDFGVAKALSVSTGDGDPNALTSLGVALGTPSYIAPEQATADPTTDHRADLYSFGAMAYELLSGKTPFSAKTPTAMLAAHISERPTPLIERRPDVPPALASLVMQCLEKSADRRPQTADEIMKMLDEVVLTRDDARTPTDERDSHNAPVVAPPPIRSPEQPIRRSSTKRYVTIGIAAVIVALGVMIGRNLAARRGLPTPADFPPPPASAAKSIAVLPLANVNADPANEYLSDGLSDEIMGALGKVPGLRVASRTSAFAFKGKSLDAREIGKRLNVTTLLEGSMRRDGDQLRVNVQLTNVADNLALWTGKYRLRMKDVFSVQDSISQAVVAALVGKLSGEDSARMTKKGTEQVDAYDLYLKGRFFVNKNTEPDIREGLGYYDKALALDPNFARASAGVAYGWIALADDYVAPKDAYPRAKSAAHTALRLDSTLADAEAALGAVSLWYDWNAKSAVRELTGAMRLDSNDVYPYRYYGNLLKATGKFDSALAVIRRAQALEPLSAGRANSVALMYITLGRFDDAIAQAKKALEIDPNYADAHLAMGNALLGKGKPADAVVEFSRGPKMQNRMRSGIAMAEATLGHRDRALGIAHNLEAESQQHYIGPENIAAVYVALGDKDSAFAWLEKAYQARSAYMALLRSDRRWDPIRGDPRFAALVKKVGL
jgi:TolB-like protein/Tfp pilus assembly protein PilF